MGCRLPAPPTGGVTGPCALEVAVAEWTAGADLGLNAAQQAGMPLQEARPALVAMLVIEHRSAPGREVRGRHQAGYVRPVFEQHAAPIDEPRQRGAIVRTETAPQRQMMGAVHDV